MTWFPSFYRKLTNNSRRKTRRSSHRPAGPWQAGLTLERLEDRTVPSGGLVNVGELVAPDTNVKSLYDMVLDPTTGMGYWGTDTSVPGAIVKVDLTGPLPAIVSENTTGIGGSFHNGFTTAAIDTSNPDPTKHYLYIPQRDASNGSYLVKYSPGVGNLAPQPLAQLATPNNGGINLAVIDNTTGYAYFGVAAGGHNYLFRIRLSDFTLQGVETLATSSGLGQHGVIDTANHILYYVSAEGGLPALEKVDLANFANGATNVGTYFEFGSKIDALDPHYAGNMPTTYGLNLIFDQIHNLLYLGTYSFDSSAGQVNNNAWPYNQATIVRIDPTGAGAGFAGSVVSILDLQPGERNLAVAGFDRPDGDIIYATDNTYPMHIYRVHVGDGSQPMQEIGSLKMNGGSQAPFPDGTSHPESTPATQGEIFARSACFYNGNLFVGTDTPPGQFIKVAVTPNVTATLQSISIAPVNPSVAEGSRRQFTATGNYSDGSVQDLTSSVTWTSTNTVVAGINAAGLATARGTGQTTIFAASGSFSANTVLTGTASGLTPNADFVEDLYLNFLKRVGDTANPNDAGVWVNALNNGTATQAAVANAIARSSEALGVVVDGLYLKLLGRTADPAGRAGFVSFLHNGGTVEQTITMIVTTAEYNALAGSPAAFVQSLYNKLLGRVGGSGEISSWVSVLPSLGEAGVANALLNSGEFRGDVIQQLYGFKPAPTATVASLFPNLMLRAAPPSSAEVNGWVNSGLDILTIAVDFAGSSEFFKNA